MESVLNNGQSEEVNIYPNPTQQNFHVHWNTTSNENILVMVVNMYGEKVYQAVYKPSDLIIFGMDFKPGVYFAKIRQGEFTKSIKLIKI